MFGALASLGCGLSALPTWARRLHRVKACIDAARINLRARVDA